jgi:hypothetical protein
MVGYMQRYIPQEKDTERELGHSQDMETGTAKLRRASLTGWTSLEVADLAYSTGLE